MKPVRIIGGSWMVICCAYAFMCAIAIDHILSLGRGLFSQDVFSQDVIVGVSILMSFLVGSFAAASLGMNRKWARYYLGFIIFLSMLYFSGWVVSPRANGYFRALSVSMVIFSMYSLYILICSHGKLKIQPNPEGCASAKPLARPLLNKPSNFL
jgi:hypothetical protein